LEENIQIVMRELKKSHYIMSDKEKLMCKKLFGSETYYDTVEKKFEDDLKKIEHKDAMAWKKANEGKYSFTRWTPMTFQELEDWYDEKTKEKEEGMKLINPDFKVLDLDKDYTNHQQDLKDTQQASKDTSHEKYKKDIYNLGLEETALEQDLKDCSKFQGDRHIRDQMYFMHNQNFMKDNTEEMKKQYKEVRDDANNNTVKVDDAEGQEQEYNEKLWNAMKEMKKVPDDIVADMQDRENRTGKEFREKAYNRGDYGGDQDLGEDRSRMKVDKKVRSQKFGKDQIWKGKEGREEKG
jgi:hypothetical protein